MEIRESNIPLKRRSFFLRVLGGLAGGWMSGNLLSDGGRSARDMKNTDAVQVSINPLAVPRTAKDTALHDN